MTGNTRSSRAILITGDTLALDPAIRKLIDEEAALLKQRYPTTPVALSIAIGEEFDQVSGHRVRCELAADLPDRRQLMVRDAHKEASAAVRAVFATARRQLRRITARRKRRDGRAGGEVQPTGT
jgi:ribosome-associated translation inhibitor RaiA